MKIFRFRFWQVLALISGAIIAVVMALASISYNSTLGTLEPAFALVPISNRSLFEGLALAFDLGMIASVFGFWHWLKSNRVAAAFCTVLFVIASLFSVHSVRGYIALNITKSLAPMKRNNDVYASLKLELGEAQAHLSELRSSKLKARGRRRKGLRKEIATQVLMIREVLARLVSTKITAHVSPLAGLEWFLAVTLWFFNATMWSAWFGTASRLLGRTASTKSDHGARLRTQPHDRDGVRGWLAEYQSTNPDHCARLFENYKSWCALQYREDLPKRKFYVRLIELGARKFRDGRNGPMFYELPQTPPLNDMLGE